MNVAELKRLLTDVDDSLSIDMEISRGGRVWSLGNVAAVNWATGERSLVLRAARSTPEVSASANLS